MGTPFLWAARMMESSTLQLPASSTGYYVRARGLAVGTEEPYTGRRGDAWFYTNPIWVVPRGRPRRPTPLGPGMLSDDTV